MQKTANQRVQELRSELGLNVIDFCSKAGISNGTYFNITNGSLMSNGTVKSICLGLGISQEWLVNGRGEKFFEVAPDPIENPYKDALVKELKETNSYLQGRISALEELLKLAFGGKAPANFKLLLTRLGLLDKSGRVLREAA